MTAVGSKPLAVLRTIGVVALITTANAAIASMAHDLEWLDEQKVRKLGQFKGDATNRQTHNFGIRQRMLTNQQIRPDNTMFFQLGFRAWFAGAENSVGMDSATPLIDCRLFQVSDETVSDCTSNEFAEIFDQPRTGPVRIVKLFVYVPLCSGRKLPFFRTSIFAWAHDFDHDIVCTISDVYLFRGIHERWTNDKAGTEDSDESSLFVFDHASRTCHDHSFIVTYPVQGTFAESAEYDGQENVDNTHEGIAVRQWN